MLKFYKIYIEIKGKTMSKSNYNEELWEEIPRFAYMALGRRGREQISLRECFIPSCNSVDEDKLHPINKEKESKIVANGDAELQKLKFLIHCDVCKQNFKLIFERHLNNKLKNSESEEKKIVLERVFATNADEKENFGEIGFIQQN